VTLLLVVAGLPFRETPAAAASPARPELLPPMGWTALLVPAAVLVLACLGPAAVLTIERGAPPSVLGQRSAPASPVGCRIDPVTGTADPARAQYAMACDDRVWTITLQCTSARSAGARLAEVRQAMLGAYDAEEARAEIVAGAPAWQSVVVAKPPLVAGVSTWIDGRPATGGFAQRLSLARGSLSGGGPAPVVMAIVLRPGRPLTDAQLGTALNDVARFAAAQ
jgi:hypothetical protein